jgi:UTP--glucose-1-phosphate uridylyltransferase
MVEQVNLDKVESYGIVDIVEKVSIPFKSIPMKGMVEKPTLQVAPSNLAILGRYILPPQILGLLEKIKPGVGGEIQLTDALDALLGNEGLNALKTDADIYDCGDKLGYLSANLAVGLRDLKSRAHIHTLFNKLTENNF